MDCEEYYCTQRLLRRGQKTDRIDDNLGAISKRITFFKDNTLPVIKYYDDMGRLFVVSSTTIIQISTWNIVRGHLVYSKSTSCCDVFLFAYILLIVIKCTNLNSHYGIFNITDMEVFSKLKKNQNWSHMCIYSLNGKILIVKCMYFFQNFQYLIIQKFELIWELLAT